MKRRTVNSLLGFVVPLVLTAVLILGWRAPLFLRGGGEMMYFLLAVAMGYPAHQSHVIPLTDDVRYRLDERRDYLVPKRALEDVAIFL